MIAHLLIPLLLLLLVVVQTTILNLLTLGWFGLELSLIVVVYAGFHLDLLRGSLISLLLGFFLDCLTSAIFGLYLFLYLLLYFFSLAVADKVYAEKPLLIGTFTGLCSFLEGLLIVLIYRLFLNADLLSAIPKLFIPQAIVVGLLSPALFGLLHRYEVLLHAEDTRPARRL